MQLELKCGTVWQITSLHLCLSHFSPADSNNIMFHWLSLLCHFTCLSLFHHFLSCLSVTDTLSLSPYHYPLSSFPTVIPISPFSPFYWQLSHGISDATVSTRLSSPSFSKTYVLFPSPPLTLSYWQLSWSIDVVKYFFFLCVTTVLILVLQPLIGSHSGICYPMWWVTERTHWVIFHLVLRLVLPFLLFLLLSRIDCHSLSVHECVCACEMLLFSTFSNACWQGLRWTLS